MTNLHDSEHFDNEDFNSDEEHEEMTEKINDHDDFNSDEEQDDEMDEMAEKINDYCRSRMNSCKQPKFIDDYELIEDVEETVPRNTDQFLRDLLMEPVEMCEEVDGDGSTPEDLYVNEDEWEDILMTLTADSGAGNHVLSREDAPGYKVGPSEGSRRGKGFVGVDGVRIPNEGEVELNLAGPQGKFKSTFQVAKVTRPLMSIARICDRGHRVVFEKGHASVLNTKGEEICRFARKGNLYMIDVKLKAPSSGFTRRG